MVQDLNFYDELHEQFDKEVRNEVIYVLNKNENFAITDISHSRAVIRIKGIQAKEILKKVVRLILMSLKRIIVLVPFFMELLF